MGRQAKDRDFAERETIKASRRDNKSTRLPVKFVPRFWDETDQRLSVVKRIRCRYAVLKDACGGDESPQRDLLVQRIAFLAILIETAEVKAAEGEEIDIGVYTQSLNAFLGLLRAVGLDRRVKNVSDLSTYLEKQNGRK